MMNIKKVCISLATLLAVGSLGMAVACNDGGTSASSIHSSSESGSTASAESTSSEENNSSSNGKEEEETFVPIYPKDDETITWQAPLSGNGAPYNTRYEYVEGYAELPLKKNKELYFSFSAQRSGQYALYSIGGAENVTVTQYYASSQNITKPGTPAYETEGNNFYSLLNYSEKEVSVEWRATYGIKAKADVTIKVRFVRVADPLKESQTITNEITASELSGKAQNAPVGTSPALVPWTDTDNVSYFYDEDYAMTVTPLTDGDPVTVKGFYRLGTKEEPGEVIWAAITKIPTRLFDRTFATIQYEGNNLCLYVETDENGDYHVNDYTDFIMSNGGEMVSDPTGQLIPATGNPKKLCYENVVNADGMYPVNQELFEFLSLYVKNNPPFVEEGETVADENKWLAPCYYYAELEKGSKEAPIDCVTGENTVNVNKTYASVYYTLKSPSGTTTYTVSSTSENLLMYYNGVNYGKSGSFTVTLEADILGKTLEFKTADGGTGSFSFTVNEASGTPENPIVLNTLGKLTLPLQEIILLDGDKLCQAVFTYTVSQNGTLTITTDDTLEIDVDNATLKDGALTTAVVIDETTGTAVITIVVSATTLTETTVEIIFTPEA
ncbi:MAG: hypothetical protein IJX88_04830 [Clostridia bacterium]|nr:hypothetical protein [Clostridia bacterium]